MFMLKDCKYKNGKKIDCKCKNAKDKYLRAVETLLIEEKALNSHAKEIINALINSGCEVRADKKVNKLFKGKLKKTIERWKAEYLDAIISIKAVKNVNFAVKHILKYGTMHTDSIITNNSRC